MKIYIRNMACESCKVIVLQALKKLKLHPLKIELGEVELKENITPEQKQKLNTFLKDVQMEIVENPSAILVEKIKNCVVAYVRATTQTTNFSNYIGNILHYDYKYLSNLFSEIESCTITAYITAVKMEYAKELIIFKELTLSEIAEKLHYSNLSHFSVQFRKYAGMPPSVFKESDKKQRLAKHQLSGKK